MIDDNELNSKFQRVVSEIPKRRKSLWNIEKWASIDDWNSKCMEYK